jgi:hypothetical protein
MDCGPRTADCGLRDYGLRTTGLWTTDYGTMDYGTMDYGTMDYGLRTTDYGLRTTKPEGRGLIPAALRSSLDDLSRYWRMTRGQPTGPVAKPRWKGGTAAVRYAGNREKPRSLAASRRCFQWRPVRFGLKNVFPSWPCRIASGRKWAEGLFEQVSRRRLTAIFRNEQPCAATRSTTAKRREKRNRPLARKWTLPGCRWGR